MVDNIFDIKFQYYPSKVWETKPIGEVTLKQFIHSHKNPKEDILEVFSEIERASNSGDSKRKDWLKQNKLYYFCPTTVFDGVGRSYENIVRFNPFMTIEFDKIDNPEKLKKEIFDTVKSVICAYLSPSKNGCKFIIRIPVCKSVDEYKEYFCGMAFYMDKIIGFDQANYNPSLPLFLSYDKDMLVRENPSIWAVKGGKINDFNKVSSSNLGKIENLTDAKVQKVKNIFKTAINRIDDNAHPQMLGIASAAGGYVGAGYMDYQEMEDFIFELIEDNDYMQKNIKGYQRSARNMIVKGMNKELFLDEDLDD